MTNELKPCPCGAKARVVKGVDSWSIACDDTSCDWALIDYTSLETLVATWNRRGPSPAPTVSVEECVEVAEHAWTHVKAHQAEFMDDAAWVRHVISAVHALCVSRLTGAATRSDRESGGRLVRDTWIAFCREIGDTKPSHIASWEELSENDKEVDRRIYEACVLSVGAATRSETIEACAKIADEIERCERGFRELALASRDTQRASDFEEGASVAASIAVAIRSLASHPASVVGEARPSFEDIDEDLRKAHRATDWDPRAREYLDAARDKIRAALYERGAK